MIMKQPEPLTSTVSRQSISRFIDPSDPNFLSVHNALLYSIDAIERQGKHTFPIF